MAESLEYWRSMQAVIPTNVRLIEIAGKDVKFEGVVVDSRFVNADKKCPASKLELTVKAAGSDLMLEAYFNTGYDLRRKHGKSNARNGIYGDVLYAPTESIISAVQLLQALSAAGAGSRGIFGGRLGLIERGYPELNLGYAKLLIGEPEKEYLFNRALPLERPKPLF